MKLSQLSAGLLFLHGHISDPALATALADASERASTRTSRSRAMHLLGSLAYLGGRPMHPGHNFDLEEPFEQPASGRRGARGRPFGPARRPRAVQATCTGCG
ncbi:MAG TPA: hypothetical protein VLM17_04770 [Xanthomonadaceae bacterium]|nr:hypothetical protein [Xanthomonadaceae bacterium]